MEGSRRRATALIHGPDLGKRFRKPLRTALGRQKVFWAFPARDIEIPDPRHYEKCRRKLVEVRLASTL
jgi:hypothetical protein